MKALRKVFIVALGLLMLGSLAACTGTQTPVATSTPNVTAPSVAATPATTPATTAAGDKEVIWGTNAAFMPFEMRSGDKVIGVDADIAAKIAEKLGATLKVEDMEFDSLPAALSSGKIDFIAAGFTKNEERAQSMDFSDTYFTAVQVVLVKDGTTAIVKEEDLVGKRIGVQNGTTGDLFVASEIEGATIQRYDSLQLAAQDLKNDKLDCIIGDDKPSEYLISAMGGLVKVAGIVYDDEEYAIAVKKGENAELLAAINAVIAELKASGEIEKLVEQYSLGE